MGAGADFDAVLAPAAAAVSVASSPFGSMSELGPDSVTHSVTSEPATGWAMNGSTDVGAVIDRPPAANGVPDTDDVPSAAPDPAEAAEPDGIRDTAASLPPPPLLLPALLRLGDWLMPARRMLFLLASCCRPPPPPPLLLRPTEPPPPERCCCRWEFPVSAAVPGGVAGMLACGRLGAVPGRITCPVRVTCAQ